MAGLLLHSTIEAAPTGGGGVSGGAGASRTFAPAAPAVGLPWWGLILAAAALIFFVKEWRHGK